MKAFVLSLALAALWCVPAAAQDESLPPLSFAFAHHVGSGIYSVKGRTVQVYTLPFDVTVRSPEERRWGLRVTLPVTIGFFDFKPVDVLETGLPEHVGTFSLVPGLAADVAVTEIWTLTPFGEYGVARDMEGGDVATVNSLGLASEVRLPTGEYPLRIANQLLVSGSRNESTEESDSYGEFRSGVELTFPLGFSIRGRQADLAAFFSNYTYFKPPDDVLAPLAASAQGTGTIRLQWEAGVTFGTRERLKLWKIPLPRLGISYRFGDGPDFIRIVFGAPF